MRRLNHAAERLTGEDMNMEVGHFLMRMAAMIGERPIAAFGNSDGDLAMLQYTGLGDDSKRLCLFVHHTDDVREYAYDRNSKIGRLDKGLTEAAAHNWVVVDMKNDWNRIFPFDTDVATK